MITWKAAIVCDHWDCDKEQRGEVELTLVSQEAFGGHIIVIEVGRLPKDWQDASDCSSSWNHGEKKGMYCCPKHKHKDK